MSLGVKLRQLRQAKNMSQADVAFQLDVSQPAYNKWETDQAKPTIDKLMKISEILETDIQDLLLSDNSNNSLNVITSNSTFEYSNIVYPKDSTVNIQSSEEFLKNIIQNQEQITKLIEVQNSLIENLMKK